MADKTKVNPMTMPRSQLRPVIEKIGYGVQFWPTGVKTGVIDVADLYGYLLAATNKEPLDKYDELSVSEILDLVDLEMTPNPQTPSKP